MKARRWKVKGERTTQWSADLDFWRVQLGYHVYRHSNAVTSDRWVFHPTFTYDRKEHK